MQILLERASASTFTGLAFDDNNRFLILGVHVHLFLAVRAVFADKMYLEIVIVKDSVSHRME